MKEINAQSWFVFVFLTLALYISANSLLSLFIFLIFNFFNYLNHSRLDLLLLSMSLYCSSPNLPSASFLLK